MMKMISSTILPKKLQSLLAFFFVALFMSIQLNGQTEFKTKWAFGAAATQLNFNALTVGAVNYTWSTAPSGKNGTGSFTMNTAGAVTLTGLNIAAGDSLTLSMTPTNLRRFYISQGVDRSKLVDVTRWGTVAWTSMQNAFSGCNNLKISASDAPNLSGVSDMSSMFLGATNFNSNIGGWNTATVTNMSNLFKDCTYFNQNIGGWNTAAVTMMTSMFQGAFFFNQNIGGWNTAKVTEMSLMFNNAGVFNQNIGSWNTANVKGMFSMFSLAGSFDQNIGNWNTSKVTVMGNMFFQASAFNQNIGKWILPATVDLTNMLSSSGMDCDHYTATLVGWAKNNPTVTNRMLGASDLQYGSSAVAARNTLVNTLKWTISGDSPGVGKCDVLLSSPELLFKFDLTVYPNPTTGWVSVKDLDRATFSITDLSGKVLSKGDTQDGRIDFGHLENGVYLLKIQTDEYTSTQKIWKQ